MYEKGRPSCAGRFGGYIFEMNILRTAMDFFLPVWPGCCGLWPGCCGLWPGLNAPSPSCGSYAALRQPTPVQGVRCPPEQVWPSTPSTTSAAEVAISTAQPRGRRGWPGSGSQWARPSMRPEALGGACAVHGSLALVCGAGVSRRRRARRCLDALRPHSRRSVGSLRGRWSVVGRRSCLDAHHVASPRALSGRGRQGEGARVLRRGDRGLPCTPWPRCPPMSRSP